MKHTRVLIAGLVLLCALPIVGTLMDASNGTDRTVRLSAPTDTVINRTY